jgi:Zn-dependent metalloprotease/PKD repeat protein
MKSTFYLFILCFAMQSTSTCLAQQVFYGKEASEKYPFATLVRLKGENRVPDYIQFSSDLAINESQTVEFLRKVFKLSSDYSFELVKEEQDDMGQNHQIYQQYYREVPVEFGRYKAHFKEGRLTSINGAFYTNINQSASPSIVPELAIQAALNKVNASTYKWDIIQEEALLKAERQDISATYYPSPELIWIATNYTNPIFQLAYKMDVYANEPLSRQNLYVDAHTGLVIFSTDQIHTADSNGVAVTAYSGNRAIVADYFSSQFRLRESGRGNGIQTFDLNNTSNYGAAIDFIDVDNFWNNTTNQDQYAGDAHWGAEMTYDYFWQIHNRNSIDGNGFALKSYMHYNTNYNNAFWDGQRMTYGDGNGTTFTPLTAIDITGHEIAHGLTSNTSNLVYANESGALNESFSDIFGVSVESFANNNALNWVIGEDATPSGNGIRSMSNPNAFQDPDTYLGTNYYTGTQDNGGVHTNSGVQNFWFYLLSIGGTGTNDIGQAYNVTGLGMIDAARIAFRNNTFYLTPNSDYQDARFYAIQSAIDLFGACSPEVMATTNAWHAVGVGQVFSYTVNAQFSTAFQNYCQAPALVNFSNQSFNAGTFQWNFGDGGTSTALNPSHTYQNPGLYTVTLIASGGACGSDTTILVDYINVDPSLPCAITMNPSGANQNQSACVGTLFDPGGGAANYQDLVTSEITIAPTGAASLTLTFSVFDLEPNYDYLYIYDGPSNTSPLIGQYTGNTLPSGGTIQSSFGAVTLKFFSDTYVTNPGFVMTWACQIPTAEPIADFMATSTSSCSGDISFQDQSTNGPSVWAWDFGDGGVSNSQNPLHIYTQDGIYDVTLVASNAFGSDTFSINQYITIDRPDAPSVIGAIICTPDSVSVTATALGDLSIWDEEFGGNVVATGGLYTSYLQQTDTLWAESSEDQAALYVGPVNSSFGTGGQHNNTTVQYMIFSVNEPLTVVSAWVNAAAAGDRTITLWDASGNQLDSRFLNIPSGGSRISLNFHLDPGVAYRIGGSQMNLYRNNAGAIFPYQLPGLLSITGSSAGGAFYYYFYDWEVVKDPCISPRTPIYLIMDEVQASAVINTTGMTASVSVNNSLNANVYAWDFGDGTTASSELPSHTYSLPGTYSVTLVASNDNCSDTLVYEVNPDNAGLVDLTSFMVELYPNPSSAMVHVKTNLASIEKIQVFESSGRLTLSRNGQGSEIDVDVSKLQSGNYVFKIYTTEGLHVRSFVKMP